MCVGQMQVAIVGEASDKVAAHAAAVAAVSGLQLSHDDDAAIVAVCHAHVEQRMYACEQALERGRMVICSTPPASSLRHTRRLLAVAETQGGTLLCEAGPVFGGFSEAADTALRTQNGTVYARLQVGLPASRIVAETAGVLETHAYWCLPLLQHWFGPIDTIAAHSRALLRTSTPAEDLVVAHLEFVNGLEATLEVHALASDDMATTRLEAFGAGSTIRLERELYTEQVVGLQRQYEWLRDGGTARGAATDLLEAASLSRWLRQSSRLSRRLHRRELPSE